MTQGEYIFDGASDAPELERLRGLESVFDDKTRQWLLLAGPLAGRHCLEVGAGAGSIARWMGAEVGATGRVTAVDANARFLKGLGPQVDVVEGELGAVSLPAEGFDLVHARYVLIHNADAAALVDLMLRALKPGGAIVLEEPDFAAAAVLTGPAHLRRAFENVKGAIEATFSSRGMTYAFGSLLPGLVQAATSGLVSVEYDCAVEKGGSALAEMMRLSTLALQDKYIAAGHATPEDIARYAEFATTPDCWGTYYATVRVFARKASR